MVTTEALTQPYPTITTLSSSTAISFEDNVTARRDDQLPSIGSSSQPPLPSSDPGELRTLETLEPFEPTWQNARRRTNRRRNRPQNLFQRSNDIFLQSKPQSFKKHYIVKADSGENLSEVDTIAANRELETCIGGKPKKIIETRAGHLLIEVASPKQSLAILNLRQLNGVPVQVMADNSLNKCKGTVRYFNNPKFSEERILSELKNDKVSDIYQMKRKVNGVLEPLPTYILTFDSCELPDEVKIGLTVCRVRLYIPRPRRCFKCQAFGHGASSCRSEIEVCCNCSRKKHDGPV